jgi:hypothetical protein
MADQKRYGLKLKGANGENDTAYTVPPLPGFYFVHTPTPVGGEGELDLDVVKRALKAPDRDEAGKDKPGKGYVDGYYGLGDVLELVTLKQVGEAQEAQEDALAAARGGMAAVRREARDRALSDEERQRLNQEAAALEATPASQVPAERV